MTHDASRTNFNVPYKAEREGQIEFFENYGIPYDNDNSVLIDNTDGIYNGSIFEFKLNITNLNKTLFQAIKYLSRMRISGESVPATILLIDLNATTVYVYKSREYFEAIHKTYTGAASKENDGFVAGPYAAMLDYSDMVQSSQVRKLLKRNKINPDEMYMPVDIDENCIVGWAERYYRELPHANKGDFLGDDSGTAVKITGEIREPRHFKGLINPYTGKSNEKFKYLMDCLNDRLSKKDLGAFYTPEPYARKAAELVEKAVARVPEGNDYIILDRCAGTGNLEAALIGLTDKNGDELISHCVVSTYEYYEYKVLLERIGDKVRDIVPPSEANVIYENGKIINADAMSEDFINNPVIRQYVDNPKCTIILFENPPYHDESSGVSGGKVERSGKRQSYVTKEMKSEVKGVATNELANQFIWSGFKYYLRQATDSYIVFSPIKYWKQYDFCKTLPVKAFLFNRMYFHATASSISCILWTNEPSDTEEIAASIYDIKDENVVLLHGQMKGDQKNEIMDSFAAGKINILVTTSVIEVGVDVPNANMMVIFNADRFGLSQLHQLRGRIGRGQTQSFCVFVSDPKTEIGKKRMNIITSTSNGFKLAEEDLKLRGEGDVFGKAQSGLPQFQVGDVVNDYNALVTAQKEARNLIKSDPALVNSENKFLQEVLKYKKDLNNN